MAPSESCQKSITGSRPSLCCGLCKRSKVRCGKERPFCANCVKKSEACKYEYESHPKFPQGTTHDQNEGLSIGGTKTADGNTIDSQSRHRAGGALSSSNSVSRDDRHRRRKQYIPRTLAVNGNHLFHETGDEGIHPGHTTN